MFSHLPDFPAAPLLALYGGTFDPIHHGHLLLARDALEQLALDGVIFIPAAHSPHKLAHAPASGEIRSAMIAAAISGEPRLALDCCELRRAAPSYTIDTVEEMRTRFPQARFSYFLGADQLPELASWRRIEDLRKLVNFVVFTRLGRGSLPAISDTAEMLKDAPALSRSIEISATEIRARVARGASIRYFVPETVAAIIAAETFTVPRPIKSEKLARLCAHLAAEKKAEDIVAIDLRAISTFTDFFVICSGTSEPHLKAIAGELHERLKLDHRVTPLAVDGYPLSQWVIADYTDVVVHIFHREKRDFYSLEDLWGDAPRLDLREEIGVPAPVAR